MSTLTLLCGREHHLVSISQFEFQTVQPSQTYTSGIWCNLRDTLLFFCYPLGVLSKRRTRHKHWLSSGPWSDLGAVPTFSVATCGFLSADRSCADSDTSVVRLLDDYHFGGCGDRPVVVLPMGVYNRARDSNCSEPARILLLVSA